MHASLRQLCGVGALTLALSSTLNGQTVMGRAVERGSKRPLRDAQVGLVADSTVVAKGTTNSLGEFYLDAPRPGLYRIAVVGQFDSVYYSDTIRATGDPATERQVLLEIPVTRIYFEFEVEKQVSPLPGNRAPRYPEELRAANVEGEVIVQFVVDGRGVPRMGTFKVLRSSDYRFTNAVLLAIPLMRFQPAVVRGQNVPQLVHMPFQFALTR